MGLNALKLKTYLLDVTLKKYTLDITTTRVADPTLEKKPDPDPTYFLLRTFTFYFFLSA